MFPACPAGEKVAPLCTDLELGDLGPALPVNISASDNTELVARLRGDLAASEPPAPTHPVKLLVPWYGNVPMPCNIEEQESCHSTDHDTIGWSQKGRPAESAG